MSLLLTLAATDRVARNASRAVTGAADDHGADITLVLPRPQFGSLGRPRRRSVPPVSPIMPLPDSLSARQLMSRGQAVTITVGLTVVGGLLTLRLVTGIGPS